MNRNYGRDLDLNLLRVFVVVAEAGSVTEAASRLYVTQPAVSAAIKRLTAAIGAPLFARAGRGLVLTARGRGLLAAARPHVDALVEAALSPVAFDAKTSERTLRLGLSDSSDWLLPAMLRIFAREAPRMRVVVVPIQFRTVADAFASARIDAAVTVADELPAGIERRPLRSGPFVCLFDPRHARLGARPTLKRYLAHDHVIVSYNGDLRGVVEDLARVQRRVRVSVPSFQQVGAIVEGSALVATVPALVATDILALRRKLRVAPLPFALATAAVELLWRSATSDDPAVAFVRDVVERVARERA